MLTFHIEDSSLVANFTDKRKYFSASLLGFLLFLIEVPSFEQIVSNRTNGVANNDSVFCINNFQHLLLKEDSTIVNAKSITKTIDGNFLVPGFYYPNAGVYYKMPYLIKCTPKGNILWSKTYPSQGTYPSNWFTANVIKELHNGDLLMVGEIGIPATDDRRELAVWRLDKNGNQIWAQSYESSLWTNPITGSTEVTGIQEDAPGNIFLSGNLRFFESSKFSFLLKINSKGIVLWDKNFGTINPLAFGSVLLQNKLTLIGGSGPYTITPSLNSNLLWCINIDLNNGDVLITKAWHADFDQLSLANSFDYANTSVALLDNGQIGVFGTANSDFLAFVGQTTDTIRHSIIADFSTDFDFVSGIMLASKHSTNYSNTLATQHPNGRISYTRFNETHDLYNEDIIYGSIQNDHVIRERIYHETNRSGTTVSNFLFFPPSEDIIVQSYSDSTTHNGGLEMIRLNDGEIADKCSGTDTSLTFIQPYFMKQSTIVIDSIITNTFHVTHHNFVNQSQGNLSKISGCQLASPNDHFIPDISLDTNTTICIGSSRELLAGAGYSQYLWSNGSTDPSISVSDTGKYWVSVTDQNGCKGSDTISITKFLTPPFAFLPHDTSICNGQNLTIMPNGTYKNYQWSNFSNERTITINQPGLYWLQVTDSNSCISTDSIQIKQGACNGELFVPNAFTPNGDGLNDLFKPLLSGNVTSFRFTIFNRWGEKVFDTQSLQQGWDGKLHGTAERSGVFIWVCQYQLGGQALQTKKGTVTLVR
ncbi:MAG TPA: gliding motility-associated C-terminal domain-containing protein [Chitinophagaceae bacterium]